MEKKRTQAADIAEIASKLDGKVEFSTIVYSQKCYPKSTGKPGLMICILSAKNLGYGFIQAGRHWIAFVI